MGCSSSKDMYDRAVALKKETDIAVEAHSKVLVENIFYQAKQERTNKPWIHEYTTPHICIKGHPKIVINRVVDRFSQMGFSCTLMSNAVTIRWKEATEGEALHWKSLTDERVIMHINTIVDILLSFFSDCPDYSLISEGELSCYAVVNVNRDLHWFLNHIQGRCDKIQPDGVIVQAIRRRCEANKEKQTLAIKSAIAFARANKYPFAVCKMSDKTRFFWNREMQKEGFSFTRSFVHDDRTNIQWHVKEDDSKEETIIGSINLNLQDSKDSKVEFSEESPLLSSNKNDENIFDYCIQQLQIKCKHAIKQESDIFDAIKRGEDRFLVMSMREWIEDMALAQKVNYMEACHAFETFPSKCPTIERFKIAKDKYRLFLSL